MKSIVKYALIAGGVLAVGAGALGATYYFMTYPREAFLVLPVDGTPSLTPTTAPIAAKKFGWRGMFGAKLATKSQLKAAQAAGAAWCPGGWVAEDDGSTVKDLQWPMQTMPIDPTTKKPITGCGFENQVNTCNTCWGGATVYGKKPAKTTALVNDLRVIPWSAAKWSKSS
jgi:hypothetical protein